MRSPSGSTIDVFLYGCCTRAYLSVGGVPRRFAFHLQNSMLREWSRGNSNPWPPPCKVRDLSSPSFILVQEILQTANLSIRCFAVVRYRSRGLVYYWCISAASRRTSSHTTSSAPKPR